LVKLISDDILIISFSYNFERENLLYFNACFDSYAVVRIASYLSDFHSLNNLPLHMDVFLPKCGRNTLAEMIYFAKSINNTVYMGECDPIMINPSTVGTLKDIFKIASISSARNDSEIVNKL
jgi:hypothetical protein